MPDLSIISNQEFQNDLGKKKPDQTDRVIRFNFIDAYSHLMVFESAVIN